MIKFVIITPAHNEEAFIEKTAQAMVAQTMRPLKWVVVNDGSTDRTAEIMKQYVSAYDFIKLISVPREQGRDFARKVRAFNRGLKEVTGMDYNYIGNVDADISFDPHYFDNILRIFESDSTLGVSGGVVYTNVNGRFVTADQTLDSVGGAVQLFRRQCFEEIGGYMHLKYGGVDAAAEIMARMKGWKVRKSIENRVLEHRRTGTAETQLLMSKIREGRRFYSLGYDPVFYMLRCMYRLKCPPYVLGSAAAFWGYLHSMIMRYPCVLPKDVIKYLRSEQRAKLKLAFGVSAPVGSRFKH